MTAVWTGLYRVRFLYYFIARFLIMQKYSSVDIVTTVWIGLYRVRFARTVSYLSLPRNVLAVGTCGYFPGEERYHVRNYTLL